MVEHFRDVHHSSRLLDNSEDKVVVLRTVETNAKSAHLFDECAPQHRKMTGVVLGQETFR